LYRKPHLSASIRNFAKAGFAQTGLPKRRARNERSLAGEAGPPSALNFNGLS